MAAGPDVYVDVAFPFIVFDYVQPHGLILVMFFPLEVYITQAWRLNQTPLRPSGEGLFPGNPVERPMKQNDIFGQKLPGRLAFFTEKSY